MAMINLEKAKEDEVRYTQGKMEEERQIVLNERRLENLKKSIEQSKKDAAYKKKQISVTKKRIRELEADSDSASKRIHLLYFEYFDVAKKQKTEEENGKVVQVELIPYLTSRRIEGMPFVLRAVQKRLFFQTEVRAPMWTHSMLFLLSSYRAG
jgi:bisphosphoglycerate-dependent phosphoglycerate mutase